MKKTSVHRVVCCHLSSRVIIKTARMAKLIVRDKS